MSEIELEPLARQSAPPVTVIVPDPPVPSEGIVERLRRLDAFLTDDLQHALEREDAQGAADMRWLTRIGMVLAILSVLAALVLI